MFNHFWWWTGKTWPGHSLSWIDKWHINGTNDQDSRFTLNLKMEHGFLNRPLKFPVVVFFDHFWGLSWHTNPNQRGLLKSSGSASFAIFERASKVSVIEGYVCFIYFPCLDTLGSSCMWYCFHVHAVSFAGNRVCNWLFWHADVSSIGKKICNNVIHCNRILK